jgi:hypothetical protein
MILPPSKCKEPLQKFEAALSLYQWLASYLLKIYSTVTDFAKLRGWSTLQPRITAI